ncbi:MAG: POTRA domain-containing protein [Pyrinomonadaceae bacterium]
MLTHLLMICALATPTLIDRSVRLELDARDTQMGEPAPFRCTQPTAEQAAIIRQAEASDYTIRRLEFAGNAHIRDGVLRKKMRDLQEGEKFKRNNLVRGLASVSRLKTIHPVRFSDVVLRLEETDKLVDVIICFREKGIAKR